MKKLLLFCLCTFAAICINVNAQPTIKTVESPNKKIKVAVAFTINKKVEYAIYYNGEIVLTTSKLGLVRTDADFYEQLTLLSTSKKEWVNDHYKTYNAKKSPIIYTSNKQVFHLQNKLGNKMDIIFQVSNDGVAFRYFFPDSSVIIKKITQENTSFHFPATTKAWLQPMDDAKSGWAKTNPSYEEFYQQNIEVSTPAPFKAGRVYPALFKTNNTWVLLTESFPQGNYCFTRLRAKSPNGEYSVGFPQKTETLPNGALNPESSTPWYSPWRIIAIGSLKTIAESTLGTDLAEPAVNMDTSFIKPGKAAWSWVLLKDKNTVFSVQQKFIDYAATMHWQYCLIDADWDTQIGYSKIAELATYGKTKNVGVLLWYNSAGD